MGETSAGAAGPVARCSVHLFGHSLLDIGGAEVVVRGPIKRGLLAMLALDLGRPVHADRLVDGLWEESVKGDVLRSLRVHISQLRTLLDAQVPGARAYLEGRYPLYRLSDRVTSDFADASARRDRALDRLAHDPEGALGDLDAARRLVAGDPLAEILHLPFAQFAREPLRSFQMQLADDYAEVATAAWGSREVEEAMGAPRASPRMDERRWRLFTRLVDAPSSAAPAPRSEDRPRARVTGSDGDDPARPHHRPAVPIELASRAPAVFVGRHRERAALLELQAAVVRDGHTRVAMIAGPGGVGKTSLAATVAAELAAEGTAVRYVSWSGSPLAAHAPLVSAGLLGAADQDQTHSTPPLGQDALAGEIIERLGELDDCCVALIFDDVHRLPARYHPVLVRVLESPDLAVLAVLLHRPDPAIRELEQALPATTTRMRLRPFSDDELTELADALGESSRTAVGRHLPWVAGLLLAAPGDAPDDRIGEAVEQLVPRERELLEWLALAPGGLMLRTLQHDSDLTPVETLDRLRTLVAAGLVTEVDGRPPRFVIAHDLIGAAVRERAGVATSIERAASLHDALALTGAPLGERVPLALTGADLLGDRAEDTVTAAARQLVREGAFADAIALAEAAQELGVARSERSRIVVDGAQVLGQAALGERTDAAGRLLDLARDAADRQDWEAVTTVLQWRTRLGVADPLVGKLLESALEAIHESEPRLRFEILWSLVFHTMFASGRVREAMPLVEEMLEIGDELRDPGMRARALACSHWLETTLNASPERLGALTDAMAEHATAANDEQLTALVYGSRIGNAIRVHAIDAVEANLEGMRRARDPHTRWRALLVQAMLQLDHVELEAAEATIAESSAFARDRGLIVRGDEALAQTFVLAWARGTLGELRPLLEALKPNALGQQGWMAALALARIATGDRDGAVAMANEVMSTMTPTISDWDWYSAITNALLADVARFGDAPEVASHVIEQLTPISGGRVLLGLGVDLGPVDRYLALAHRALGARDASAHWRSRARSQAGCALWRSRVDRDEHATGAIVPATGPEWSWIQTT